jgi:DNA modification methylase
LTSVPAARNIRTDPTKNRQNVAREALAVDPAFNTIHRTDCIRGLQQLQPGSIDLAFADPPFNIGYDYDVYDDKRDADAYLTWTRQWMEGVRGALKPTGTFWIAIGDEYAAEIKTIATRELGLTCRSWVIWYYTFGVNCSKKFSRSHAHLFHFVKDAKKFTFNGNDKDVRVPSARQLVYADNRAHPTGRLPDDTWILRPQDVPNGFTADQDTWYFPRVAGTFKERAGFHGCQMPEQLLGRIIRCCSNPGDVVLDPFSGSGTTLAVANKLGRRWVGFELSEEYAKKALERIRNTKVGQALEGAPEPVVSAPRTPKLPASNGTAPPPPRIEHSQSKKHAEVERAIASAFVVAGQGFSTDRVIADPELNSAFVEQCRILGVPGLPTSWNRTLLAVRKAARLTALPTPVRTKFSTAELDRYMFASEIAIQTMIRAKGLTLDDILCDPQQAGEFDQIARTFAPGYSSLEYRWAALTFRKRAREVHLPEHLRTSPTKFQRLREYQPKKLDSVPGTYLLRTDRYVYAGQTVDLGARVRLKLDVFNPWNDISPDIEIGVIPLPGEKKWITGLQSVLVRSKNPDLNYRELAVG